MISKNYTDTIAVNFNGDINRMAKLADIAEKFDGEIDLIYGGKLYDCKSFMALCNLDLTKDYQVALITPDTEYATKTIERINTEVNIYDRKEV